MSNLLKDTHPHLLDEWDYEKNKELGLDINKITYGSNNVAWWVGKHCGHPWDAKVNDRNQGQGCPYCANPPQRILVGFNDMWTTNPELASQLLNPEDGYKYLQFSNKKVDWRCESCDSIVENRSIAIVNSRDVNCGKCTDGFSYSERVVYHLFNRYKISFNHETSFEWSDKRRYDFHIEDLKLLLEMHGIQHFEEKFQIDGRRTLQEEQENDIYKEKMAKENGIEYYIAIDARKRNIDFLSKNILASGLLELLGIDESINWDELHKKSKKTLYQEIVNLWNTGIPIGAVMDNMKLSDARVRRILIQATKNGGADYSKKESTRRGKKALEVRIVQLTTSGDYIGEFESLKVAYKAVGLKGYSSISKVCTGVRQIAGGFKWMYKEEYDKMVESK